MNTNTICSLFLFLVSSLPYLNAYATSIQTSCLVSGLDEYSYSASLTKNKNYRFSLRGKETETHNLGVLINGCEKAAGKFLMVGLGVNDFSLDASTYATVYTDTLDRLQCSIENNNLQTPMSEELRKNIHKEKTNFLRKCITTSIAHNSGTPLKYREDRPGCHVTKIGPQKAIIDGGLCFFKINRDSEFVVTHMIKDECLKQDYLRVNNIKLREVNTSATFAIAGSPTGTDKDLELLPSKLYNFMIEPTSEYFSISEDWGKDIPQLPSDYRIPDLDFGEVKIKNLNEASIIKFPLLVDNNNCEDICINDICTASCNYSTPIVAEVVFSEIQNGKKIYLKSWYDGAVALPNWQGFLNMPAQYLKGIILNDKGRYQIDLVFRDPKTDFTMYNKSVTPLFMPLPGIPTMDFAATLLNGLPTISSGKPIPEIETHDLLPDYGVIRDFGQYSGANGTDGIQTLSKFRFWPQFFDNVCNDQTCIQISSRPYMEMSLTFTIDGINTSGDFNLKDIIKSKKSKFGHNIKNKISSLPRIKCSWDELD